MKALCLRPTSMAMTRVSAVQRLLRRCYTIPTLAHGGKKIIDARSDTVTRPTAEMTIAMMDAGVGDDVYGEDPTVRELEQLGAEALGHAQALFVPSGTMGNLIALAVHAQRGEEVIVGDECHIRHYEQGGASSLLGIPLWPIPTQPSGELLLSDITKAIKPDDPHYSHTRGVAIENPHNRMGGRVLPPSYVRDLHAFCQDRELFLHLDGARLMNAAVALQVPASEIAGHTDSVNMCLSKSLGAPVGSILAGSPEFIYKARRWRKALGGGMRQSGVVAAAGIVALEKGPANLRQDHQNARMIAKMLSKTVPGLRVDLSSVETNMVYAIIEPEAMGAVGGSAGLAQKLRERRILIDQVADNQIRIVTHHQVSQEECEELIDAVEAIMQDALP